ncbi:MAG: serine/threonine protein kinase [Thiotrichaceae bacterium]|nr:serine/threonine protein kinase [Thiotrichaceae bacterium]
MAISRNEKLESNFQDEVEEAFFEALEQPIEEQSAWLKSQYNNSTLVDEVHSLLEAHHGAGFLDASSDTLSKTTNATETQCPNLVGRTLGAYTVIRQINKGGMGRIYIAQRNDGEYDKVVAIKVVEVAGIDVSRFFQERQVLANLEHPNIVTLLDGGTLPEGFPYIVMEYVDGDPIDEFAIHNHYNKRQIVSLCLDLCHVTHRSHQHGVIHCDIKPANILVTPTAKLKLLDFGIAQTLVNTHSDQSHSNHPFALTPIYSSPQRHNQMPSHIADDIYSIGIVLGQLLSKKIPPKIQRVSRFKKKFDIANTKAMAKKISNRELRAIFCKATHENRDQRYSSAYAFKNDLNNWINHNPVDAVGKRPLYLVRKHIGHYWRWWLSSAIALVLLYQPINLYFANQERIEQDRLLKEAKHDDEAKQRGAEEEIIEMVQELESLGVVGKSNIKEYLYFINQSVEYNSELSKSKHPDSEVLHRLHIQTKILLAKYTGHPYELSVGKTYHAKELYRKTLSEEEAWLRKHPENEVKINILDIKHQLAKFLLYSGAYESSIEELNMINHEALSLLQSSPATKAELVKRRLIIPINLSRTHLYIQLGRLTEAKALIKTSLQELRTINNSIELHQHLFIELKIHISLLEIQSKQVNPNLETYQQMKQTAQSLALLKDNLHNTPQLLLMRIENSLACTALAINKTALAQQHLQTAITYSYQVRKHNINIKRINQIYNHYTQRSKSLIEKLQCTDPKEYILPSS